MSRGETSGGPHRDLVDLITPSIVAGRYRETGELVAEWLGDDKPVLEVRSMVSALHAAATSPDTTAALTELASCLRQLAATETLEALYRVILELQPGHSHIAYRLGRLLAEQERHEEAVICFRTALEDPPWRPLEQARCHVGLARSLTALGQFDEAEKQLDEALRLAPGWAQALNARGLLWVRQGRVLQALAYLRTAASKAPDNPLFLSDLDAALKAVPTTSPPRDEADEADSETIEPVSSSKTPVSAGLLYDRKWCEPASWRIGHLENLLAVDSVEFTQWPLDYGQFDRPKARQLWVDAITNRGRYLAHKLQRVPHWPVVYRDPTISVVLIPGDRDWIRVWVGFPETGEGCVASFKPVGWGYACRQRSAGFFTVGVGMSLFLDVALRLHRPNDLNGQLSFYRATASAESDGLWLGPNVWNDDEASVERIASTPRPTSWVSGHVRRLPPWQTPSHEQIALAPGYVRITMGGQDTYVLPHHRGKGDPVARILKQFTKTTNLLDALAATAQ